MENSVECSSCDRIRELHVLNQIGQALTANPNYRAQNIIELILGQTGLLMDVTNFYIAFHNPSYEEVTFALYIEDGKRLTKEDLHRSARRNGNGLSEYVIRTGEPLCIPRGVDDWLKQNGVDAIGKIAQSWIGVPLNLPNRCLGMIGNQSYSPEISYDDHDRLVLETIASCAAIALQNAGMFAYLDALAARCSRIVDMSLQLLGTHSTEEIVKNPALPDGASQSKCSCSGRLACSL